MQHSEQRSEQGNETTDGGHSNAAAHWRLKPNGWNEGIAEPKNKKSKIWTMH